jgi:hypothetical protein
MTWHSGIERIVRSIEAGEIPSAEDLGRISQATLGMCVELVRSRRECRLRALVGKVLGVGKDGNE